MKSSGNGPVFDEALLALDPDEVFKAKNIDQVKDLTRNLQRESDRKREELRTLVGERYRDLMEAAETIICMRDTSNGVLNQLQSLQDSMGNLGQQLKSFQPQKFDEVDKSGNCKEDETQYALAAQIKLLMDIPERIWNAIEAGEFVTATKLYLFARHIHTNLSFQDVENFAIIDRQWAAISQFHEIIKNASDTKICDNESDVEVTLDSMISVILLKGSKKGIFEDFLSKRKTELVKQMKKHDKSAKSHIRSSLSSIASVLVIVHQAFYRHELASRIHAISQEKIVQLLNVTVESPVMEYLPSIIKDFRLIQDDKSAQDELPKEDQIKESCAKWLDEIHELLSKETLGILSHVHSIGGLSNIRSSVHSFMSNCSVMSSLDESCSELLGHAINLWDEFYRNQFRDRIESILATHFAGITSAFSAVARALSFS